jgi:hypothetical protein
MAAYDGHMEQEQSESQAEESRYGSVHVDCRESGPYESSTSDMEARMFGLENRMSGLGDDLSYRANVGCAWLVIVAGCVGSALPFLEAWGQEDDSGRKRVSV